GYDFATCTGDSRRAGPTSSAARGLLPVADGAGASGTSTGDAVDGPRLRRAPGDDRFADLAVSRAPRWNDGRAAARVAAAGAVRHRRMERGHGAAARRRLRRRTPLGGGEAQGGIRAGPVGALRRAARYDDPLRW